MTYGQPVYGAMPPLQPQLTHPPSAPMLGGNAMHQVAATNVAQAPAPAQSLITQNPPMQAGGAMQHFPAGNVGHAHVHASAPAHANAMHRAGVPMNHSTTSQVPQHGPGFPPQPWQQIHSSQLAMPSQVSASSQIPTQQMSSIPNAASQQGMPGASCSGFQPNARGNAQ